MSFITVSTPVSGLLITLYSQQFRSFSGHYFLRRPYLELEGTTSNKKDPCVTVPSGVLRNVNSSCALSKVLFQPVLLMMFTNPYIHGITMSTASPQN